ncbi:MAG TPA: hypothetical protein VFR37_06140 [Longimicrobium sp.]|nr:hypothetical protein [Longimicrobium sp.]
MTTSAPDVRTAADEPVATTQPVLTSQQLRRIAEGVSGYRGSPRFWLVLTQGEDGSLAYRAEPEDPGSLPNAVVIPCQTPLAAERPPVVSATIQAAGAEPVDLLHLHLEDDEGHVIHTADAVFWGESSVEKFVVPYYASVYGNDAGEAVTDLLNTYNGTGAAEGAELEGTEGEPNPTEVYGLVHIPRSEYIELDLEPTAQQSTRHAHHERFAVLAFNPVTGRHRVVTVEEYRKRRGGS